MPGRSVRPAFVQSTHFIVMHTAVPCAHETVTQGQARVREPAELWLPENMESRWQAIVAPYRPSLFRCLVIVADFVMLACSLEPVVF